MVSKSAPSAKKVLLNLFLSICIIGLLGFGVIKTTQLNDTQKVLASTQNELTVTQSDLSDTQTTLATTETELSQTQSDLTTTETKLSQTQSDLTTTQTNLSNKQNELKTTNQKLEDKSSQLAQTQADYTKSLKALDTEKELYAGLQSSLNNLQANYNTLTTGYGYVLKDPTYQQLKAFIAADRTDTNAYVLDSYVCEDFSADVKVHAMQQKIRYAYVSIRFFGNNSGHAIVAFNTTDRGIIYIEPQSDEEVNLQAGKHYWTQCIITTVHYTTTFDDTIDRFNIIW